MDISSIAGIGPKKLEALHKTGFYSISDLLYNIPRTWIDRTTVNKISQIRDGENVVLMGKLVRGGIVRGRKSRYIGVLSDGTGEVQLLFFNYVAGIARKLVLGKRYIVIGSVGSYRGFQMVHPEIQEVEDDAEYNGGFVPVYSISEACHEAKMEQKFFRTLYEKLFRMPNLTLDRGCPRELTEFLGMKPVVENLRRLHLPMSMGDAYQGKRQLKILELLPFCLRMASRRRALLERGSERRVDLGRVLEAKSKLPFALTNDQEHALQEILDGLNGKRQFHALLQGDVGSGKTVVAMLAMLGVCGGGIAKGGEQCALMVPTDILARQHYASLKPFFEAAGLRVELLLGSMGAAERRTLLGELQMGLVDAVIGTHALFSRDVEYAKLGLVIIDEQHRFGVNQREALLAKGNYPDMLVMSATPIPRSLAMTLYGDLHTIIIKEKPPGRKPVQTRVMPPTKREDLKRYLLKEIKGGNRCYWVVSRIGADENEDPANGEKIQGLEEVVEELKNFSSEWKVAYVHGQMDDEERENNLRAFARGDVQMLVATTVIEVGVNVPEANLMVIDHPERFGLAQLHQLRGRVGRGSIAAWCFLICKQDDSAFERLSKFASTEDGFEIAEMDLATRGAGNLEGSEQSGSWVFHWFDWIADKDLISKTLETAELILDSRDKFSEKGLVKIQNWYAELPKGNQDGIH